MLWKHKEMQGCVRDGGGVGGGGGGGGWVRQEGGKGRVKQCGK